MGAPQNYISISRRPPDFEDYLNILRRYRSWIIGPGFAGLVLAVVAAFLWPDTYLSTAMMQITPQQVPEKLVPSAINSQMAQRLTQMQQEILSRASLTAMVQKVGLYPSELRRMPMDDVVDKMRGDIKITMIDAPSDGSNRTVASAFMIQFKYKDAHKAQAVVQQLVSKFEDQNATVQRNEANLTASFLGDEVKSAKEDLDRLDGEITKFKVENEGRLPEQFQANIQTLNSLQQQLGSIDETLNRNEQEKTLLETQEKQLQTQLEYFTTYAQQTAPTEAVRNDRLANLNKMISDGQAQLTSMLQVYTEANPDVKNFRGRLAAMEKERSDLLKQEASAPPPAPKKITNPQIVKSVDDTKASIAMIKAQIKGKEADITERQKRRDATNRAIAAYQSRIDGSPASEQRYAALLRDYQIAKDKYDDLSKREQISETAQNLEERKAGENLEELDPPSLPQKPTAPNRLAIVGAGAAGGLLLGLVLAGMWEMKDTSLKNLKDVRAYTNLPVLSSIPLLENALLVRRTRRLAFLGWSAAVIVGTIAMSSSMYYYYFGRS